MQKTKKYCASLDNDIFRDEFDSLEEAIKYAKDSGWSQVYIGEPEPKTFMEYLDVDSIFENMAETACDDVGEVAEDWLDVSTQEKEELEELIEKWAKKHNLAPTFYGVENIVFYNLSKDSNQSKK